MERSNIVAVNCLDVCTGPVETFYSNEGTVATTVDYILVQKQSLSLIESCVSQMDDHCDNLSFHLPVACSIKINLMPPAASSQSKNRRNFVRVSAWKVVQQDTAICQSYQDAVKCKLDCSKDTFISIDSVDKVEDAVRCICNVLKSAEDEKVPITKFKPYLKPNWKSLKSFHNESRRCRAKWIRNGRQREHSNKYFVEYKNAKRLFRREIRRKQHETESKQFESLEEMFETDRSSFYKALSKIRKKKGKDFIGLKVDDNIVTEETELLNVWKAHYSDLFTPKDNVDFDAEFKESIEKKVNEYKGLSFNVVDDILDKPFTVDQVSGICIDLPNGKSGGLDGIVYEHVKYAGEAFFEVLCATLNAIRHLEDVSESISIGLIKSLFKNGKKDRLDKDNYRGITLLNIFGKILERVMLQPMKHKLQELNIPNKFQFAYQKDKSCTTASFVLQEAISHYAERNSKVYCCFLDTSKAFDTVWIDALFYKLFNAGIRGKTWRLLYNWYSKMSSCVMHAGLISSKFPVFQGVRQGGVLSPWLFLVFNNDIPEELAISSDGLCIGHSLCDSILVANDIALLSSRVVGLQTMISAIEKYSRCWRFEFNVTKTRAVVFGETSRARNISMGKRKWLLNGQEIEESDMYTHVGITLSGNFRSRNRTEEAGKKGIEVVSSLMSSGIRPGGINPIVGANVWLTIGLPRMLYGCELWNNLTQTEIDILNRTNRFAAKRLQGLGPQTKSEAAIGSIGLWNIEGYIDKRKLLFLGNLCRAETNSVQKEIFIFRLYSFLYGSSQKNQGFVPDIYRILHKYNLREVMDDYLVNQSFPSKNLWKNLVVNTIDRTQMVNWRFGIATKPELQVFGSVHQKLKPLVLWQVAKRHSYAIKLIANLVNLLCGNIPSTIMSAVRECDGDYKCNFCDNVAPNIAMHFILQCRVTSRSRDEMWDEITDNLDIRLSAALFNLDDRDLFASLIGGHSPLPNINTDDLDQFVLLSAGCVFNIFKEVISCQALARV